MAPVSVRLRVLPQILPIDGREVELQATATFIQWRYVADHNGEYAWQDLIAIADITGVPGPAIELRTDGSYIQYRTIGAAAWINLILVSDLVGPQGVPGEQGPQGPSVADGDKGDVVVSGTGTVWTLNRATEPEAEDTDETTASNIKVMTVLRTLQAIRAGIKEHAYVTPLMLNADNTDGINAQAEVQASIDEAIANSCAWYLPAGHYRLDTYVNVSERITMRGAGMRNAVLRGRENGPGVLVVQPPATGQSNDKNAFFDFANFGVENANFVGAAAMNCILAPNPNPMLEQGAFMAQFIIQRMYFGATGGPALLLDNTAENYDGFFTFAVRDSWLAGGVRGYNVGDSINIERNQLVLGAPGTIGVDFTGTPGAQQVIIHDNNITTTGGAIALVGVEMASIRNNQGEHPAYVRDYDGRFGAHYYIANCLQPTILNNTISPGPTTGNRGDGTPHIAAADALVIDGSTADAVLRDNIISMGQSGRHINVAPSVSRTTFSGTNRAYAGQTLTILDDGADSRGRTKFLALQNGFTVGAYGTPSAHKGPTGLVTLDGSVSHPSSAGIIAVLPQGLRPPSERLFRVAQNTAAATIQVSSNGNISVSDAVAFTNIMLSGISFQAT